MKVLPEGKEGIRGKSERLIFFLVGILSVVLTNIDKMDDQTLDRRSAWSETTGIPL